MKEMILNEIISKEIDYINRKYQVPKKLYINKRMYSQLCSELENKSLIRLHGMMIRIIKTKSIVIK